MSTTQFLVEADRVRFGLPFHSKRAYFTAQFGGASEKGSSDASVHPPLSAYAEALFAAEVGLRDR